MADDPQAVIVNNWFTAYVKDLLNINSNVNLTKPLEEFLSGIDIVLLDEDHRIAFTSSLLGVSSPSELLPHM